MSIDTHSELSSDICIKYPKKYKVFLLNDDYTSMDFVIEILMSIFHKTNQEAQNIMLKVHNDGKAVCGVYTYEIAQTKVMQVAKTAKENGFVLKAVMEEE